MKRFLVHTIILLGLLAPALFAQSDSSVQAGSALGSLEEELRKPSQSELYRRARVALVESIKKTISHEDYNTYGVDFESAFPMLLRRLSRETVSSR